MTYRVAVRALCEFTAKCGDLDLRFTPAPSAQEGIAGHRLVASRRPAHYRAEVKLAGAYEELQLSGRADGYDAQANRLEEIKTYRGEFAAIPHNHQTLHWAQLKIYGSLQCATLALDGIQLALVYFNIDTERETVLEDHFTADALQAFCAMHCDRFLGWARQEQAHRAARNQAMQTLPFPHEDFRRGQRALAEAVYKAVCTGTHLLAQAPTGIGKTVGTLFPLLKSFPLQAIDKGFFLTAKTTGRTLALDAIAQIRQRDPTLPLRALELIARDKLCEFPDRECHGESCPLARGFYDRLAAARQAAVNVPVLDHSALRLVAAARQVCPYYLAQEMARWCDLIVGDYNYFFDASALLHSLTVEHDWKIALLVDEAHNLIDRARGMYSAMMDEAEIHAVRTLAPAPIKRSLGRLQKRWRALSDGQRADYAVFPQPILLALQNAVVTIGDYHLKNPANVDKRLLTFYFNAMHFCALAESFGEHSLLHLEKPPAQIGGHNVKSMLCIRNVSPAPFLAPRFECTQATVLFSATLFPAAFHRDLLGLPSPTCVIEVPSPFLSTQLQVNIVSHISTRFTQRHASIAPIAQLIAAQYAEAPGNYIAYFSSFDYLNRVAAELREMEIAIPMQLQTPRMTERERHAFLESFTATNSQVGFAVLGGAFGEGIDLPGDRLIGAFIATLGLPQFNPVNEQFRRRLGALFGRGRGYDYAYLFPGMQKIIQAAGRVIRTVHDRGAVYLIDDRFAQNSIQKLFPSWWEATTAVEHPIHEIDVITKIRKLSLHSLP
jgi:Rad3-related DNA helicase